ncbi:hypothetical protein B0T17DRAFT_310062 [Bombardia bombarda]|uniref:EF-hand domain-containing protein n=1 Tax=Bombardia bombarda TaxID=252184 RepID=A0AA40C202_9PEZI|nr:hypothetical protein B0T17DRAFT_310062 [Bombardia bombarda]
MAFGESDIKTAFKGGDDDGDDTLSVSEAVSALEKLGGSVGSSTVESACRSCGVDTSREMDFDEFVKVVRHLESGGDL